jgi:hypothetical protein
VESRDRSRGEGRCASGSESNFNIALQFFSFNFLDVTRCYPMVSSMLKMLHHFFLNFKEQLLLFKLEPIIVLHVHRSLPAAARILF